MPLSSGTRLGPYEIAALLGAGGMGEVYRARDTRLQREVALKILHSDFASNPDRRARFEREARAVAALSHPNIVALYDIGEDSGHLYMVSELVPGETLRDRLQAGALTTRDTLDIAVQIADGIAAAHETGITHRDLKPENIMIASGRTVKILDFGLARLESEKTIAQTEATVTVHHQTQPGMVMGTPHYMSPEQARGLATDYRSDQFSFGVILHELLTGKPAFRRASIPETMVAILKEDAPPIDTPIPAPLRWIIDRLLAKDPDDRYASSKDLYRDLRALRERLSVTSSATLPTVAPPPSRRRSLWPYGLAAACIVAGFAGALLLAPASGNDESRYKFTALARDESRQDSPRWSPDGKSIAYEARVKGVLQIFVRAIGAPNAAQLTHARQGCSYPFWSPDGSTVYCRFNGAYWAVAASGGAPQLAFKSDIAAIHPDGKTLAVVRNGKLFIGPADESRQREYHHDSFPSNAQFNDLQFSSDGSLLAAVAWPASSAAGQSPDLWILPWQSAGKPRKIPGIPRLLTVSWFPDSRRLLFQHDDGTTASLVVLDAATGRMRTIWNYPGNLNSCSVSPDGKRIALAAGGILSDLTDVSLPDGHLSTLLTVNTNLNSMMDWAPSGTHYLHTTTSPASIQDRSVDEGSVRALVTLQSEGIPASTVAFQYPRWSPDGQRIAFNLGFGGGAASRQLWLLNLSGGRPFPLSGAPYGWDPGWSPDGEWLSFYSVGDKSNPGFHLSKIRASAGARPVLLVADASGRAGSQWSAAGDWILYSSTKGLSLVSPDGKLHRQLTARTLASSGFSKRGDQVYGIFRDAPAQGAVWRLISIDVQSGAEKQIATLDLPPDVNVSHFSLHPDGSRFTISVDRSRVDIYQLEGFDQPKSWLDRLLRR